VPKIERNIKRIARFLAENSSETPKLSQKKMVKITVNSDFNTDPCSDEPLGKVTANYVDLDLNEGTLNFF
jgi:hypothetical protein